MKNNPNRHSPSSHSVYDSQTLSIIRSIVDELYQINKHEILSRNDSQEKYVRFTLEEVTDRTESVPSKDPQSLETPMKSQSTWADLPTIAGRSAIDPSRIDLSVSIDDPLSLQCDCATQTMDINVLPECSYSFVSSLTDSNAEPSNKIKNFPLVETFPPHSPRIKQSCQNSYALPLLSTAHQLIVPTEGKYYNIYQDQTLENSSVASNDNIHCPDSSIQSEDLSKWNYHQALLKSDENIAKTNMTLSTCLKRKRAAFSEQGRLLDELYLSPQSLQSMSDDGLVYIHDLIIRFRRNAPQFHRMLVKRYHVSPKQAISIAKAIEQCWKKYETAVSSNDRSR